MVSNPNKYEVSGTTGGRPIYEKRRKNEFEMFIRFETLDNSWYFQAKEHLTGRINYAHFTCSQVGCIHNVQYIMYSVPTDRLKSKNL